LRRGKGWAAEVKESGGSGKEKIRGEEKGREEGRGGREVGTYFVGYLRDLVVQPRMKKVILTECAARTAKNLVRAEFCLAFPKICVFLSRHFSAF
jgi:hypothetical protein